MPSVYQQVRHWMWGLDPIHVGMGRQQVSRIDMPVTREPGTNLPVVPGSSLTGVCRTYAAFRHAASGLLCAGKGNENGEGHCGRDTCPVCCAFGFSKDNSQKSRQGLAQITTAHILLFPIASQHGPVWITSYRQLQEAGLLVGAEIPPSVAEGHFIAAQGVRETLSGNIQHLSLGWLTLQRQIGPPIIGEWRFPGIISDDRGQSDSRLPFENRLGPVVIVDNALFATLVNDNMEVRTLVSIDPATGAAAAHMLFTYEAIPRGALLWFEVIYTNPLTYNILESDMTPDKMKSAVLAGFGLMKFLGVGGMNTRGLGRVEIRSTTAEVDA